MLKLTISRTRQGQVHMVAVWTWFLRSIPVGHAEHIRLPALRILQLHAAGVHGARVVAEGVVCQ